MFLLSLFNVVFGQELVKKQIHSPVEKLTSLQDERTKFVAESVEDNAALDGSRKKRDLKNPADRLAGFSKPRMQGAKKNGDKKNKKGDGSNKRSSGRHRK